MARPLESKLEPRNRGFGCHGAQAKRHHFHYKKEGPCCGSSHGRVQADSKPHPSRTQEKKEREREEKDRRYLADSYKAEAHPY